MSSGGITLGEDLSMKIPVQVTFHDMPVSDAMEAHCWKEAERLAGFFDRITACHVTIVAACRAVAPGGIREVRINLSVPRREIIVSRASAEHRGEQDLDRLIREAFERMQRQLQKHAHPQRDAMVSRDGTRRSLAHDGPFPGRPR